MKIAPFALVLVFYAVLGHCALEPTCDNILVEPRAVTRYRRLRSILNSLFTQDVPAVQMPQKERRHTKAEGSSTETWLGQGAIPYAYIDVGNPPQRLEVVLDTGSSHSWVQAIDGAPKTASTFFNRLSSYTWKSLGRFVPNGYIEGSRCLAHLGTDDVFIGGALLEAAHVGVAFNCRLIIRVRCDDGKPQEFDCRNFDEGIVGLNLASPFLAFFDAQQPKWVPRIFTFTFKDESTGEGWNSFALGNYAGLKEEDVIWMRHIPPKDKDDYHFHIELPYVEFEDGTRHNFRRGHTAIVDTGCTFSLLPGDVAWKISENYPGFQEFGNMSHPLFNRTMSRTPDRTPNMILAGGGWRWTADVVQSSPLFRPKWIETADPNGVELMFPTYISTGNPFLDAPEEEVPSLVGIHLLRMQKGVVFDFTPGKERVGFVPRDGKRPRAA
jgi:hypothetical protein